MIEIERYESPQGCILCSEHFAVRIRIWKQSQEYRAALAIRKPEAFDRNRVPKRRLFEIEHENFDEAGDPEDWAKEALRGYREEIEALIGMLEEDNA